MSTSPASQKTLPGIEEIRSWFPSLQTDFTFLENAGGSQVPACVANAIRDYMMTDYVQLGAGYPASERATEVVHHAHETMETWMNVTDKGKVVLGSSATALVNVIANAYADVLKPGDEFIICETNHEANAGPWERLERRGAVIKTWKIDPETLECSLKSLGELITDRTVLVAFPQVSNLLGEVVDVPAITKFVHDRGAKVFIDGVAYAPHGLVDVTAWNVDWYVFSNYKVYGPHMASLYGTFEAFGELTGPNHSFIPRDALPYKWELGAISHEGCAGIVALEKYASFLSGGLQGREAVVGATHKMESLETPLTQKLTNYLESKPGVKIIGPGSRRPSVGTLSFLSDRIASTEIPKALAKQGIGIRAGHMYAVRLCNALNIDLAEGVVRISLLHYNTDAEITRTIACLDKLI